MKFRFGFQFITAVALIATVGINAAQATSYYVSSSSGNDSNSGASGHPWKSLTKVNGHTFTAGDSILFKCGDSWTGKLAPPGSGSSSQHIVINSYNSGAKPIINGAGAQPSTVYLYNQQYWEVRNLNITNSSTGGLDYVGIMAVNDTGGVLNYIYIGGNTVTNVTGQDGKDYSIDGGICVNSYNANPYWNGVTVENNTINTCDRIGIYVGPHTGLSSPPGTGSSTSVVVNNNSLSNIGGDGVIVEYSTTPVVQYNTLANSGGRVAGGAWPYAAGMWVPVTTGGIMQYNEVYGNSGGGDGEAYDIDLWNYTTTVQYNYSHDNPNGFMLFDNDYVTTEYVRYNLSVNDGGTSNGGSGGGLFNFNYAGPTLYITNNTCYEKSSLTTPVTNYNQDAAYFYNNIFDMQGTTGYASASNVSWNSNLFYGAHPSSEPSDPNKLTTDPMLTTPGQDNNGIGNCSGYKLQFASPAIGTGVNLGSAVAGSLDYFGNSVSTSGNPNRGCDNTGGGAGGSNYVVNPSFGSGIGSWSVYSPNGTGSAVGYDNQYPFTGDTNEAWEWSGSGPYEVFLSQNSIPVPNGAYNMTAEVWDFSQPATYHNMYAENQDGTGEVATNFSQTSGYVLYTAPDVQITTGSAQVGFTSWGNANQGIRIDHVSLTPTINYIQNPSFAGGLNNWTIYSPNGTGGAVGFDNLYPYSGDTNEAWTWSTNAYQVVLSQNSIPVPNGTYTMTAEVWAFNLPSAQCDLYAENQDGTGSVTQNISASSGYVEYTIPNIQITTGLAQVGFNSSGSANQGIRIDNVTFTKN